MKRVSVKSHSRKKGRTPPRDSSGRFRKAKKKPRNKTGTKKKPARRKRSAGQLRLNL